MPVDREAGVHILDKVVEEHPDYLRDESRRTGCADTISFPTTEEEVCATLRWAGGKGIPVTTQGARTGITGGATPNGGHILNLSRMKRMLGLRADPDGNGFLLTVEPGVLLADVFKSAAAKDFPVAGWSADSLAALAAMRSSPRNFFFAPDLTETSASIGGLTACNGSGARSFFYGATRRHVTMLRAATIDGGVLALRRGDPKSVGRAFTLCPEGGRVVSGSLPAYRMPDVKNAAGYFVHGDMDLLDLIIGSEGTLAVLTRIELRLIPAPAAIWGLTAFLPDEPAALRFVRQAREQTRADAIEFIDHGALELLRCQKASNPAFQDLPDLRDGWHTAVYVEYQGESEAQVEEQVLQLTGILEACGGDPDGTWLATAARDIERFKRFRHAVPEAVNLRIDERRKSEPRLTKLGTDLSVPDAALESVMGMYRDGLTRSGLEAVSFGHIGNNHVHVNIIPRNMEDYERGKALYLEWARTVVSLGGSISAEHGVGKLKTPMLELMYGAEGVRQMRELKKCFDPRGLLNRGNLFAWA